MITRMSFISWLLLLSVHCLSVLAVQHSDRHFTSFSPYVLQVHERIVAQGSAYLPYTTNLDTEDSHVIALDLAEQALGFNTMYIVKNSYVSTHNNVRHVYLRQIADDGREIFNADLNINVHNKRAVSVGHTFYNGSTGVVAGQLSSLEALSTLMAFLKIDSGSELSSTPQIAIDIRHKIGGVEGAVSPASVRAGYVQVENGKRLEPVWDIELDMDTHWWSARVSSRSGDVISVFDWVSDVNAFNVYPIGVNDPFDGERTTIPNPAISTASPLGWNRQNSSFTYHTTIGNNAYAQANPTGSSSGWLNFPRPSGTSQNDYIFPINFEVDPVSYVNASSTNLFAWNNFIHDIFYQYGFTEQSGNFQENNFGKGGTELDAVQANCQDGAGFNNANFATPVDGQRPRMRMYVWTNSNPYRDGDLDQGIIIHEYAHGISNRLTGGPGNSNCLGYGEAGGMGEGWGDFFATVIRQRPNYQPGDLFAMGDYSANKTGGIRKYPYTTNMEIDPETYAYINDAAYSGVHAKGEVWCGILWDVYWNMVEFYGFSPDLYLGEGGNNIMLQLVIDGMKFQPCNPNFVDARDAIFKADSISYEGANYCRLWKGFAKRGLGLKAVGGTLLKPTVVQDFTYPSEC